MEKLRIVAARTARTLPLLLAGISQARQAGQRALLLVPEQYTLQAEEELIEGLQLPGLIDLDVVSPTSLARQVRERAGHSSLQPLDDLGRAMALSQALIQQRDQLSYYQGGAAMPGLTGKLSALLADLQRAAMTPEALADLAEKAASHATRLKEEDLSRIWQSYEALLAGRYADEEARQAELVATLPESGLLDGAQLFVCGFDVLQPFHCQLLLQAAKIAEGVTVALCMGRNEELDSAVFLAQQHSVQRLTGLLKEEGMAWSLTWAEAPRRTPVLDFLQGHLFADDGVSFAGEAEGISLYAAPDPHAEAAHAAALLWQWHRQGIPWGEMAVTLAETSALPSVVEQALSAAGIPHYLARKNVAARHGLCRMFLGSVRAACGGYAQEDMLEVLDSGFSPLTEEESLLMENYALENGIHRKKWLQPFTRGSAAEAMEPLRQRLVAPLQALQQRLRTARDAAGSAEALYQLLGDTDAYQRLIQREEQLIQRGLLAEASRNRQVWAQLLSLLDQLHALLGQRRATMRDLAQLLESGLESSAISGLPPQPDTVMVGEVGHLMTGSLQALLVMGLQDGALASRLDSLLTDRERLEIGDRLGRQVGVTQDEMSAMRKADFFRALTLPSAQLAISYATGTVSGEVRQPDGLVDSLRRALPLLKLQGGALSTQEEAPVSPQMALDGLSAGLRRWADGKGSAPDSLWQRAFGQLWRDPRWQGQAEELERSLHAVQGKKTLSRDEAASLYQQQQTSISQLERYAACPYAFFVQYGLQPVERREFAFQTDERGTFYHAVLQRYTDAAAAFPAWPNLPDEQIDRLIDEAIAAEQAAWAEGPLTQDAVGAELGRRYVRTVRRACWMFTRHARHSRFSAAKSEVRFGAGGTLPPLVLQLADGRQVALQGVIDRIDRWEGDQGLYLRVVDYKSSQQELDPVRVWYGLQLQLLLYMQAVLQGNPRGELAGAFYFTVKDPQVKTDEEIQEAAEQEIAKQLRLKGVVLADTQVVEAINGGSGDYVISKVFKQDGELMKSARAATALEMRRLMNYAQRKATELFDSQQQGHIEVSPARTAGRFACDMCKYPAICGRDALLRDTVERDYTGEDRDVLWQKLLHGEEAAPAE